MSDVKAPTGFQLGLPEEWEIYDLIEPTVFRLGVSDAPLHLATAHWRLGDIEHATGGAQIRARLQTTADGSPAEAECLLSVYATDVVNEADRLMVALANGDDDTDQVALPIGKAVRRTGRRPSRGGLPARFVHQFFIPVPGTDNEIVLLELWSSSFAAESVLRPQFEGIASSFEFTYDTAAEILFRNGDSVTVESGFPVRQLVRSTFAGWPGRFSVLAHLAVATWLLAALVIAGRFVVDADKGFAAILDDIFGGAFIAFFGVIGYVFDQSRDRKVPLFWLAMGSFFAWVAITCPEGRLGHLC